jgi:hypothetical protein
MCSPRGSTGHTLRSDRDSVWRCPTSGKKLDSRVHRRHDERVTSIVSEAAQRLQMLLGLSPEQAARAVAETLDSLRFEVDEYIEQRHSELQRQGVSNPEIFELIAGELPSLRFRAPELSARQIRRRIYG